MNPAQAPSAGGRVLVVDDDIEPLRATARVLRFTGFEVTTCNNGHDAMQVFEQSSFDAILSDIWMPGMNGIELLQQVRERDADVPVVLITGAPAVETAVQALDYGAFTYLVKPVQPARLEEVVQKAVHMSQMARIRREASRLVHTAVDPELSASFERAKANLWIAYQPIVTAEGSLYGHEALMRVSEPRISHPGAMLDAAERLRELGELGRLVRSLAAAPVAAGTTMGSLFVNIHPYELADDELLAPDSPLARIASRVVLEITERHNVGSILDLRGRVSKLRSRGFRIAIDDLGAGYAGLSSFALLEPDIVKLDLTLVREIDRLPVKQRLVHSITALCRDMGIRVVGEGVETREERDTLIELGCDLLQGFWLAKPGPAFPAFRW